MSKNLGDVPRQEKMSEEQEQAFTNGINKGRKLEREYLIAIIKTLWHPEEECDWGCENYGCGNGYYDALIKRLEGENK